MTNSAGPIPNSEISSIYTDVNLSRGKKNATIQVGPNMIIVPENCRELTRSLLDELGIGYLMGKDKITSKENGKKFYSLDDIEEKDYVKIMNLQLLVPEELHNAEVDVFTQPNQNIFGTEKATMPDYVKQTWRNLGKKRRTEKMVPRSYRSIKK
jgi:hypothetical protein